MKKVLFTTYLFLFPYIVLAQNATMFNNPLKANSIETLLALLIDSIIIILMPVIILAVIYSGFMFLTARGNEQKLKTAKTNFVWVIIGMVVLLGAKIISAVLQTTAEQIIK